MQSYPTVSSKRSRGFSLVELLVVIAVIGVIAAMAVLNISNVNGNSRVTAAKAQAQRIASVFGGGQAAGAPVFLAATDVASAMNAVGTGSNGAGINQSTFFQMPGVSSTMNNNRPETERPAHYLAWDSGNLIYHASGAPQQESPPQPPPFFF